MLRPPWRTLAANNGFLDLLSIKLLNFIKESKNWALFARAVFVLLADDADNLDDDEEEFFEDVRYFFSTNSKYYMSFQLLSRPDNPSAGYS